MKIADIQEIQEYLPHRYPFLLVDKVIAFEASHSITAVKNVTVNEPFFQGHFPGRPVMPGVMIIEALAQAAGVLALKSSADAANPNALYLFTGIDNARFKRIVEPGDQLILNVEMTKERVPFWKWKAEATVDGQLACSANLMTARMDPEEEK